MKLSLTYRLLRTLGLNYSEAEYGQITIWKVISQFFKGYRNAILTKYCYNSVLFAPLNPRNLRPKMWRWMGAKVGKNCFIGPYVAVDGNNANLIELGDHAHVTGSCILLCHQRDIDNYFVGDDAAKLPYVKRKITLGKGCMIGMGTIIMPGVTVGEGAIIGSGSILTKDIPPWTIAMGRPAKVVKRIPKREE